MNTNSESSADAKEICSALELAVLKYFPRPVETVDAFLFANGSAAYDPPSACLPGATIATAVVEVKRRLSFTHPF